MRIIERARPYVFLWMEDTLSTCEQIKIICKKQMKQEFQAVKLKLVILCYIHIVELILI